MAMNKKEQQMVEELRHQCWLAGALHRTVPVPPDIPIPSWDSRELTKGFLIHANISFNSYRVEPACSSSVNHGWGSQERTSVQGARALYSTKARALRALRHSIESQLAEQLAKIDQMIEEEEKKEG